MTWRRLRRWVVWQSMAFAVLLAWVGGSFLLAADPTEGLRAVRTRFHSVHTDLSADELGDVPAFLDEMFLARARIFRYKGRPRRLLDVYIFRTSERFLAYAESGDIKRVEQRRGFFSPVLDAVACHGSGPGLKKSLARESSFQFVDLLVAGGTGPPWWFKQGLASYFENASWEGGKLTVGAISSRYLPMLANAKEHGRLIPLLGLLQAGPPEDLTPLHFAEAWCFFHFLLDGPGGRNADIVSRYATFIRKGKNPVEALTEAFQAPLDKVQGAWLAWIDELLAKLPPDPTEGLTTVPTRFYLIHTDLSAKEMGDIPAFLDEMFLVYARIFRYGDRPQQPLDVYIFRTRARFIAYGEHVGNEGTERSGGFFYEEFNAMACYGSGAQLRKTLAHEGTHQFIYLVTERGCRPPPWFQEGLATYMENASWEGGQLTVGALDSRRLSVLARAKERGRFIPLRELFAVRKFTLVADGENAFELIHLRYAEAWSFVHFLLEANGGRNAGVLNAYFVRVQEGEDTVDAFAKAFRAPLEQIEAAWRGYVGGMLREHSAVTKGGATAGAAR